MQSHQRKREDESFAPPHHADGEHISRDPCLQQFRPGRALASLAAVVLVFVVAAVYQRCG